MISTDLARCQRLLSSGKVPSAGNLDNKLNYPQSRPVFSPAVCACIQQWHACSINRAFSCPACQ